MSALPKCLLLDGVDQIYSGWLKAHFEPQTSRLSAGSSCGCFAQPGRLITLLLALPFTWVAPEVTSRTGPAIFISALLTMRTIWHLCHWTLQLTLKYWSCCCNTEDVKRQGCWWTRHLTQHIHLYSRNHHSKQLESIKMIPALLWLWVFGLRGLRIAQLLRDPDKHTHHWWPWSLCPRDTSEGMQWPCRDKLQKETRLLLQALSSPVSTAIYRAMHWSLTFCIPF